MNQKYLYLLVVVVILIGILMLWPVPPSPTPSPVPELPVPMTSTTTVTMGLDATATVNGTVLDVLRVVEDSRCPSDVQCIQAGRVLVALSVQSPSGTATTTLAVGETYTTESLAITLDAVTPYPISTHQKTDAEYLFTFTITSHDPSAR